MAEEFQILQKKIMSNKIIKILINVVVCITILFLFVLIIQKFIDIKTLTNVIFRRAPIIYSLKSDYIQKNYLTNYYIKVKYKTKELNVKILKQDYYKLNTKLPKLHYNKKYDLVYSQEYLLNLYYVIHTYFAFIIIILIPYNYRNIKFLFLNIKYYNFKKAFTNYKINLPIISLTILIFFIFYNNNNIKTSYNTVFYSKNIQYDIKEILHQSYNKHAWLRINYNEEIYGFEIDNLKMFKKDKELVYYNKSIENIVTKYNLDNQLGYILFLNFIFIFLLLPFKKFYRLLLNFKWFQEFVKY